MHSFSGDFMSFMFSMGIFSAILKVFIGVYLLKTMKKELYFPYLSVRYRVIITMVSTVSVMLLNAIFNFCLKTKIPYTLFSILYATKIEDKPGKIVFLAISEYLVYVFEVFLL